MIRQKPQDSYTLVWTGDDGIDRESFDGRLALRTYERERDSKVLKTKAGAELTEFRCRPLSRGARLFVETWESASHKYSIAFMCGVVNITGLGFPWTPKEAPAGWKDGDKILDPDCLEELEQALPAQAITDIGRWILERANLGTPEKKAVNGHSVKLSSSASASSPPPGSKAS